MNKTELILIRGVSGSGKTTYAKNNYPDYNHYEADMYFNKSGKYNYDASKIKDAHIWCQDNTLNSLINGKNTVISNTFIKLWEMEYYLNLSITLNVQIKVLRMTNIYKNIHNVPQEVINRMISSFEPFITEKFVK